MSAFIYFPHFIQMPLKCAVPEKDIQDRLIDSGHGGRKEAAALPVAGQQSPGKHHIADPDRRRNRFGKGTDVDDPIRPVGCLQRGNGLAPISELTVIIILNQIPPFPDDAHRSSSSRLPMGITIPVGN